MNARDMVKACSDRQLPIDRAEKASAGAWTTTAVLWSSPRPGRGTPSACWWMSVKEDVFP